ncbi:Translation initiation factor 1 (eIF-1/SUI1) [Verrucomicrobium sp. GAS474]|uniref:translation initiation factor n=1 Tax=Verrucomicrobium sp. GAS474 TaxID=1882831 RepID=UPI00087D55E1|nr:translation initiation factor [Verrucomicrobium sp. GAS474]SDT99898.1 Translation initiation factor 1 (eIF-1/SUI1) [Verrucomicrobium sp. GAS474]
MSKPKKIDLSAAASPLAADPFAALGALDTSALPPGHDGVAPSSPEKAAKKGRLLLRREKKDRGGKTVVVASGFPNEAEADGTVRAVRKALGCGGTVEAGTSGFEIVIQGDRPAAVAEALRQLGYPVGGVIQ